MAALELYQFSFSHYNEKVRWALDYKHLPHRRHSLLPGVHIPTALWLTGQKSVPILKAGHRAIAGSASIIDHLEQRYPQKPLYPRSLQSRKRALDIQRWFDQEVGADIRRAFFYELLPAQRFTANTFSQGFSPSLRRGYRWIFPGLVPVLKLDMRITKKGHERGLARMEEALDFVAENAGDKDCLVDDHFCVADLCAASLLMISCFPPELQFDLDTPFPPQMTQWLDRWQQHPGTAWVRRIYQRHRGTSAACT